MDVPLSRYQNVALDSIQRSLKVSCSLTDGRVFFNGRSLFSRCYSSRRCKRKSPFSGTSCSFTESISCSFTERGLRPRPTPKPTKNERNKRDTDAIESNLEVSSAGFCSQIEKLVLCGRYVEALDIFGILDGESGHLGSSTYEALINACLGLKSVRGVKMVFKHMISSGFEPDLYTRNRVLLMHVKCGMMLDARNLFDEMPERNLVSWNTIITGLVDSGDYLEAFQLFLVMREELSDAGSRTFATMIRACAGLEIISVGKQLHCCATKMGFSCDIFVSCALIDMYSKCGSIDNAQYVFDEMPEKTTVGWNSIIAGYALHGYSEEALDLYYEMRDAGVKMDHFTFSIIIRICTRLASLEQAKQAHAGLVRHGYGHDTVANTALVDFYSKWGRIKDAQNIFDKMPHKNIISWNALIAGYGSHGMGTEAIKLFERMLHERMNPNHVTFLAILSACSYSGLFDRGCQIFESMVTIHNVKPRAMHYACVIELLGREALLDEAFALIRDAPFPPTVNMWAALLTACRVHKNLVLGKLAAEKIYGMEPEKLSNYVILLNIYNSSGKKEEAAAVFQTLKKKGLRMLPACTWIDVKKETHVFVSGDKCHPGSKATYEKLDELMLEISKHGYFPNKKYLLPDVDEGEEKMMLHHSEKLAVSFGLLNTSGSAPVSLVQSHRVCGDCHGAIKLIAMVTGREIILRDGSRFHRFKDGKCSCGDYW